MQSRSGSGGYDDALSMSCLNVHNERLYDLLVGADAAAAGNAGGNEDAPQQQGDGDPHHHHNVKLDIGKNVDGDVCVPGLRYVILFYVASLKFVSCDDC